MSNNLKNFYPSEKNEEDHSDEERFLFSSRMYFEKLPSTFENFEVYNRITNQNSVSVWGEIDSSKIKLNVACLDRVNWVR